MPVPYKKFPQTPWSGTTWQLITPSDSADLDYIPRGVLVGTTGDVKMTDVEGTTTIVPSLVQGVVHPFSPTRIWSTGTTAVGIMIIA